MPPDALTAPGSARGLWASWPWKPAAVQLGLAWLFLIVVFSDDWRLMFGQWWNSSTYNHVLLVPAICGWLIWQRLPDLARLEPRPWRWGLLALALAVFGWVLGGFAGFNLLRQAGAVAMLPASLLLLLGPRLFAALLFPLGYMAFLVPFGDELIPPLQTVTAGLTTLLVRLSGISATINGVFIDTPAGLFEVAEACSGVKFLIAMIALGVLVCNLCFQSWRRRAGFMALCLAVPILANGVRAWGTIFAAQYVGAERAGGIDHLIYGWIFFALVIAAVLGASWRFFDRPVDSSAIDPEALNAAPLFARLQRAVLPLWAAFAGMAVLVLGGQGWAAAADRLSAPMPARIALPEVPGWHRIDYQPQAPWQPKAEGAAHRLIGRYADSAGRQVDVFYALYASQDEGREAGAFGQGALTPGTSWAWTSNGPAMPPAKSERLLSGGRIERLALTYYRTSAVLTGSNVRLKLANIEDRLLLRARPTMLLIVSAEQGAGNDATAALTAFRAALGDPGPWMDRIAAGH